MVVERVSLCERFVGNFYIRLLTRLSRIKKILDTRQRCFFSNRLRESYGAFRGTTMLRMGARRLDRRSTLPLNLNNSTLFIIFFLVYDTPYSKRRRERPFKEMGHRFPPNGVSERLHHSLTIHREASNP